MSALSTRPSSVWASLIFILGVVTVAGSLPFDLSTRRTVFGLVATGIIIVAALSTLLVSQRYVRSAILAACVIGFSVLLLSTRTLTGRSQLSVSMIIAVLLAVIFTTLRTGEATENGRQQHELFAAFLIVLTPVWGLYSIPATFAHELGLWPTASIYLATLWGIPVVVAWVISRSKGTASRQLLLNVITGAISTLFTLALVEGAIRATGLDQIDKRDYGITIKPTQRDPGTPESPGDYVPNTIGEEKVLTYDFWGRVTSHTVTYSINSQGFRDADFTLAKPPSTYRIAFLGDSFAFGLGAQQDKIVPHLLGPMLSQATGCNVQVYNFGQAGYSTVNEAALFKDKVLAYNPDMVVVWYFLNDPNLKGTTVFLGSFDMLGFFPIARNYSSIAHLAALRLSTTPTSSEMIGVYRDGYALYDDRWLAVVSSLQSISDLARERKMTPVLFVHPVLYQLDDTYPFTDIHSQVMQTAEGAGFHGYDLFDAFKGQQAESLWVSPANQHPNEAGHAIAARFATDKLKSLIPACNSQSK